MLSGGQGALAATGGSSSCYLPNGSCAPDCYDLDPCFSQPCRTNCVPRQRVVCGDGILEVTESCDDGNEVSGDGCRDNCTGPEPGFICPVPGKRCQLLSCTGDAQLDASVPDAAFCGDGSVECGETCDDAINDGSYGGCTSDCRLAPFCGDGIVQTEFGEQCDDAINDGSYGGCAPDCTLPLSCGDGIVQIEFGEQCDNGINDGSYGGCTQQCQLAPYCGDGIVQTAYEECDMGPNPPPTALCNALCRCRDGCHN